MVIGIAARMLCTSKPEGIGIYTDEILKRWVKEHHEHQFIFFIHRKTGIVNEYEKFPNVKLVLTGLPLSQPIVQDWWYNFFLPRKIKSYKPDVLFSPYGLLPKNCPVKSLITIHDLNFEASDDFLSTSFNKFYRKQFRHSCEEAEKIIAISHFTKTEIEEYYGTSSQKIEVIYNGVSQDFSPPSADIISEVRKKYSNGEKFFLSAGAIHPRKNTAFLIKAFDLFKSKTKSKAKLLFTGSIRIPFHEWNSIIDSSSFREDILHLGYLDKDKFASVMSGAHALLYLSSYEGFGLPVAEAICCNVPVLAAQSSAPSEIGSDAILTCNENDLNDTAEKMQSLDTNESLRKILRVNSSERKKLFNWDHCAKLVWKSMMTIHKS